MIDLRLLHNCSANSYSKDNNGERTYSIVYVR